MSTEEEVADVLEGAADELLVRGRGLAYGPAFGDGGPICIINALGSASRRLFVTAEAGSALRSTLASTSAARALEQVTGVSNVVSYNNRATDDEVFDALRDTAKKLRNGELEVA